MLAGLLSGAAVHSRAATRTHPRVRTDSGVLEGKTFDSRPGDIAFLGIPYAAPPTGELRWRPPEAHASWKGVRKATAYGPACPQLPSPWLPQMLGRSQMATSEACLYLNVWTTNLDGHRKQPVMVWIHGGGNIEGSQEWPPLGAVLARQGVVMVTINYRLGVFGYFSHPALTAESPHRSSGNYGLLDQMAALRWVRENIAEFGGDPDQVIVFGASSGSLDVCDLMASPVPAGLFRGAIMQSGVCVDGLAPTLEHQEADGRRIAKDLGIEGGPDALKRLRAIPAGELLRRAREEKHVDFNPAVDGWVLREQPALTFREGRQAKVPVIVGSNADEVSIFASPIVGGRAYRPKTLAEYRHWLARAFGAHAGEVFAAYPASTDGEAPAAFRNMDTDSEFGFGAWLLAREVRESGENAYLYNFTYIGSGQFRELGAFHSEESMLLSKKYWTSWVGSPDDEKLSNVLIQYWVQFAKTLHPDKSGVVRWPPYNPDTDRCQELGRNVGQIPTPRVAGLKVFEAMLKEQLER
ncbi:MAG: carboxylesterase family protein [Acidobacteria bacterium]|nr:carboxylesterase family protein [Acidobacteriota bacterium]